MGGRLPRRVRQHCRARHLGREPRDQAVDRTGRVEYELGRVRVLRFGQRHRRAHRRPQWLRLGAQITGPYAVRQPHRLVGIERCQWRQVEIEGALAELCRLASGGVRHRRNPRGDRRRHQRATGLEPAVAAEQHGGEHVLVDAVGAEPLRHQHVHRLGQPRRFRRRLDHGDAIGEAVLRNQRPRQRRRTWRPLDCVDAARAGLRGEQAEDARTGADVEHGVAGTHAGNEGSAERGGAHRVADEQAMHVRAVVEVHRPLPSGARRRVNGTAGRPWGERHGGESAL